MTTMYNTPVLVLNQNYEPLNVCSARRAVLLVMSRKAEVLELYDHALRSQSLRLECPSVIRLQYMIKRPRQRIQLSRRDVFARDNYTCQYCGKRAHDLTIDHVVPRSKGGKHTWENLASACRTCNQRKGHKTLDQARMRLLRPPREPRGGAYWLVLRYMQSGPRAEWMMYLPRQ